MYGTFAIREGNAALEPGSAVWFDPTMADRPYTLSGAEVVGDPDVLHFVNPDGSLTPLDGEMQLIADAGLDAGILDRRLDVAALVDRRFIPPDIQAAPIDMTEAGGPAAR